MKKILITGLHSYIGNSLTSYLHENYKQNYEIIQVSMKEQPLASLHFEGVDTIVHVAGIAHVAGGNMGEVQTKLYYAINRDLAIATAQKAKEEGVRQFIYLSSMIVFGDSAALGKRKHITKDTTPCPAGVYGDSKLAAELGLQSLQEDCFQVAIVRPPMVYGKGSKGNYPKLSMIAKKIPLFPNIQNQRSMLYIENLCEFLRLLTEQNKGGIYHPQNKTYSSTTDLVKQIAEVHHKKILFTKLGNPIIYLLARVSGYIVKIFGSITYDMDLSMYEGMPYQIVDFSESIRRTEGN